MKKVISLYDLTGEAMKPWAEAGYECHCFDIQHEGSQVIDGIQYHHADLYDPATLQMIADDHSDAVFACAFPPCTDLAVSGARHYASKRETNPLFQIEATYHATQAAELFETIGCPYFIENPVSVLSTLWRKPDHSFHPFEYGRYIPLLQSEHPRWPEYIAPYDRYTKKTCLWTGNGFTMPDKDAVSAPNGLSTQHLKLGGKSQRTKDIRSATPRGFAIAVHKANK